MNCPAGPDPVQSSIRFGPAFLFPEDFMADEDWQKITKDADLKEGIPVSFDLGKSKVLLVRLKGAIYACSGKCTHYETHLDKGFLYGNIITCPSHNARFDVTNGRMAAPPALNHLKCYETKVENGEVYVRPAPKAAPVIRQDTTNRTFVILGSGAAGNAAAETLRDEGFAGRVVLVSPESALPYDRPNLSKDFLAGKTQPDWIPLHSEKFYQDRGIEFITGRKATGIDADAHTITLDNGQKLFWDSLLLATGGAPRPLMIPGKDLKGAFLLRSRGDADSIIKAIEEGARSVVVIGASFIGLEAASALGQRKLQVCVTAPENIPLGHIFGEPIGQWLKELHESRGVAFHLGRKPVEITGSQKVEGVRLDNGAVLAADLVVAGIGITPVLHYLSGTDLVKENAVPVDPCLKTFREGIYAAGDIAAVPYAPLGQRIRVEHWAVAERQGQHAARAMLGSTRPYDEVPFFWTRQHDNSVCYMGWARSFNRIAYRGPVDNNGFLAGYYKNDSLLAAASLKRGVELSILGELLKAGIEVAFNQFEDKNFDLRSLLR
jgi:apoptosis-inducing factor 3